MQDIIYVWDVFFLFDPVWDDDKTKKILFLVQDWPKLHYI